jgi:hypothetical protein
VLFFPTEAQVANIFTKSLTEAKFSKLRSTLGVPEIVIKGGYSSKSKELPYSSWKEIVPTLATGYLASTPSSTYTPESCFVRI